MVPFSAFLKCVYGAKVKDAVDIDSMMVRVVLTLGHGILYIIVFAML